MNKRRRLDKNTPLDVQPSTTGHQCRVCGQICAHKMFYPMKNFKTIGVAICSYNCKIKYHDRSNH